MPWGVYLITRSCPISGLITAEAEVISDYDDLGLVEIYNTERGEDIFKVLDLKHTTRDKLTYTVSERKTHPASMK